MPVTPPKDGRYDGGQYGFYFSDTAPANPAAIDDYTLVGMVTTWNRQRTKEVQRAEDRDGSGTIGGTKDYAINVGVNSIATGEAGQEALFDAYDTGVEGYWLMTDNVAGHIQEYGRASVTQDTDTKDNGSPATAAFVLTGSGEVTRAEVPV